MKNIILGIEKLIFITGGAIALIVIVFYALASPIFIIYAHLKIIEEGYSMWLMVPAVAQALPWLWVAGDAFKTER